MGYRDDLLARVNVADFFSRMGVELKRLNEREYRFNCPFHDDQNASANVDLTTGLWFCHTDNIGGSLIDFLMRRKGSLARDAMKQLAEWYGGAGAVVTPTPAAAPSPKSTPRTSGSRSVSAEKVRKWHEAALRNTELMRWFHDHRVYEDDTIARFELGWDGERVTIPIRDDAGTLVNVRRYKRDAEQGDKMLPLIRGSEAATRLFPIAALEQPEVILVEGEWDAMLMHQQGFTNTLTVTSGAGIFKQEWVPLFQGKKVAICYDNDEPGEKGASRVAQFLSGIAEVGIVKIPNLPPKGDVTDFFRDGRSAAELRTIIGEATPFVMSFVPPEEGEPIRVPLSQASQASYRGKRLRIPVLVSGKAMTPYTVPNRFKVHCDMSNKRLCGICPLATVMGQQEVTLSARDPKALQLIAVSDEQQMTAIKALAKAVPQCTRPQVEVYESANIEELRVIPEIDAGQDAAESEYVSRTAYLMGHGLRPNRSYEMVGYTHPLPKSQATVHLVSEAIPAQDNISSFNLTPETRERLEIFKAEGSIEPKLRDIYTDMQINVHRIAGRFEMQVAYDLAWHSVISFYFNGAFVRRGWTEVMVLGDSGQGKTEMAMGLLNHYRLGERVQGEQASGAGLIGGLEKMNETWILGWGRIPLNDKRLLVIDETQGLQSGQIESMSDIRATGIAEITKIRTERTNARCRLVWLANPSSGRPLAQYNQGVLAIRDVFKKPEDIRRLDIVLGVASGDVPLSEINTRHAAPTQPRYSSEACRDLVLWAWSRRTDQIQFTADAAEAILEVATVMGEKYHPSIPIVEPADQRLKVARLSAAIAARVYSTDESGERLVVKREHVEFIAAYLDRIYSARALSYNEYSLMMRSGETFSDEVRSAILTAMLEWPDGMVEFLRQAKVFRKTEMEEVVGLDTPTAKDYIKFLTSNRLIRSTRDGYMKTPAFITLLRDTAELPEMRVTKAAERVREEMGVDPFDA